MTNLQDIETAIKQLPPNQLAAFRSWFHQFDSDGWDADMKTDAQSGKLDVLITEAKNAAKNGQATPL